MTPERGSFPRIALKWGGLLALALALWTLAVHLLGFYTDRIQYAATVDQVVIILPLLLIGLALLEARRERGGTLRFGPAVLLGTTVAAVSAPLTVGALWYYHHYINPEWVSYLTAYEAKELTARGATLDQVAARVAQLQQGATDRSQIIGGLLGTVLMGLVIAVLLTLLIWSIDRIRRRSMVATSSVPGHHPAPAPRNGPSS